MKKIIFNVKLRKSYTDYYLKINKNEYGNVSINKKIVGIITSETQFASHGDVLVKVNDISDCSVGDILCPDENGCGRVATDEELMFMTLHAIPRPKITSLNTGIDGMVACFIV